MASRLLSVARSRSRSLSSLRSRGPLVALCSSGRKSKPHANSRQSSVDSDVHPIKPFNTRDRAGLRARRAGRGLRKVLDGITCTDPCGAPLATPWGCSDVQVEKQVRAELQKPENADLASGLAGGFAHLPRLAFLFWLVTGWFLGDFALQGLYGFRDVAKEILTFVWQSPEVQRLVFGTVGGALAKAWLYVAPVLAPVVTPLVAKLGPVCLGLFQVLRWILWLLSPDPETRIFGGSDGPTLSVEEQEAVLASDPEPGLEWATGVWESLAEVSIWHLTPSSWLVYFQSHGLVPGVDISARLAFLR